MVRIRRKAAQASLLAWTVIMAILLSPFMIPSSLGFQPVPSLVSVFPRNHLVILSAAGGGNERVKRILQIKKIKDTGGDYESLINNDQGPGVKPVTSDTEVDYMEMLMEDDDDGPLGMEDYTEEDQAMYEELKRQEKQALVNKILKAKQQAQQSSEVNKGQPSPYLSIAAKRLSEDPNERFKDVETYMPQSTSWGRWARPKNIPEAFGGGQPIPEGGVKLGDDKEWEAKYEEFMANVRDYKKEVSGVDLTPAEKMDEEEIKVAREQARRHMLRGEYDAAVNTLQPFRKTCSVRSKLGAATLMDLAVAYEAIYDFDKAQEIYTLVRSSPVKDLRSKAKALNLGAEAMKRLGLGSKQQVNPKYLVNFAYIPSQLEGSYGLYMKSRGTLDLDESERPVIDSVKDALEILEDAVIAQGVGIRMDMVPAALRAMHIDVLSAEETLGPSRVIWPTPVEELDGRWRLRVTSYQEAVDFVTKQEIWQRLESSSKTVSGRLPLAPFEIIRDVKSGYTWEPKRRVLNYEASTSAFSLPSGKPYALRVLVVRDTLMVTSRCDSKGGTPNEAYENRFAIWTRAA